MQWWDKSAKSDFNQYLLWVSRIENKPTEVFSSQVQSGIKHSGSGTRCIRTGPDFNMWICNRKSPRSGHGSLGSGPLILMSKAGTRWLYLGCFDHCCCSRSNAEATSSRESDGLQVGGVNCNQLTFSRKQLLKGLNLFFFFFFELSQNATYLEVNSCCLDDWNTVSYYKLLTCFHHSTKYENIFYHNIIIRIFQSGTLGLITEYRADL